ncbi:cyclic nucleotide-binding domain-containing protein [Magnetospira sp. QH-2]|uniref:cyclic nucleotide-binding domain-containing protein n=1 Tax=Magnetospira sp. (strain QH-2) TaxID=1288970 RepID=UPI0003E81A22|nr:cyclic nucleotide-binding domain-containing protein [Magnetospira sp. QH-2]CCQ73110.1 protein of unknown function [Magnetospira sp. QH-2]
MASLRKIQVSTGIHWIEVPEADLYVLCGSPADSVKHLMLRGLIVPMEKDGVKFESGPNAILLSDAMIQNGHFANLAEFPVLQMLYRQGMILPNHPNNKGNRPVLLGSERQVKAQMEYIFRGNYGLVSQEELEQAGMSPDEATEMMSLKLKFAFGKIRESKDLLDNRSVGVDPVEIRNGVTVRRTSFNCFEFAHNGDKVSVDLNLTEDQRYAPPYRMGFHEIKREHFGIIHSGDGDGWDVNRPCTASILMYQGYIYLIDAGPNLLHSLTALGIGTNEIKGIFHTHSHDDHFAGITALIQAGFRMKYYATPLVRHSVTKKLTALLGISEERFSDFFEVVDLNFDQWNDVEGMEVMPVHSPHPVETNLFLFRTLGEDGHRSYAHFADISSFNILEGMIRKEGQEIGITQEMFEKTKKDYLHPANIKKIDIGGGLIHGMAEDFENDPSDMIILSHTSLDLTARQKEIGSDAPFGTTHILIPDHTDIARRTAFEYLRAYFPDAVRHTTRNIMNNQLFTLNPGTIIMREGEHNTEILLILSGIVEMIKSDSPTAYPLSAGTLVGEYSGLHGLPCNATYRTASFVQAMRIPGTMYADFVHQNDFHDRIERLHETRTFLQGTWLFGEEVSYATHNVIAERTIIHHDAKPGTSIDVHAGSLFMIKSGTVDCLVGTLAVTVLKTGDFMGGESIISQPPRPTNYKVKETATILEIPADILRQIPIVMWKLLEAYDRSSN